MDNSLLLEAIDNYFNKLSVSGKTSLETQRKLLILVHLYETLCDIFVTEEDYRVIAKYLEIIYGDCIIPYPEYIEFKNKDAIESNLYARSTEKGILRVDTNKNIRVSLD